MVDGGVSNADKAYTRTSCATSYFTRDWDGTSAMMQIAFAAGFEEWRTNKGKITMADMFEDESRVPGDIGFATQRLEGKSEA